MRLSCCAYSYREYLKSGAMTLASFVETARDLGCDAVELTSYYFPSTERDYLNRLKRHIHREGLSVSGTAIGTDFTHPESANRQAHVRMAKEWIDLSVVLGAPTLRVFAGPVREGDKEEQAFKWCAACLRSCASHAARRGVLLALENHGGITGTADQILRLMRAVDSEWVGINLDCGNFTGDAYSQIAACAPHAVAVHAKTHFTGASGREAVDYVGVKSILDQAGYRGFLAIEYEESEGPHAAIPRFAAQLLGVLGRVNPIASIGHLTRQTRSDPSGEQR